MDESGANLADVYDFGVIRDLRKRLGLTLAQVSEQCGLSVSVISRLERNQTRAELETLLRLARVFGIGGSELLALAERQTSSRAHEEDHASAGFSFRQVRYGNVRCLMGSARAGGWVSRPDTHGDDFEMCWCIEGQVRVTLPRERHELKSGDAVQFDAVLEHRYEAVTDCRIIIVHVKKQNRF